MSLIPLIDSNPTFEVEVDPIAEGKPSAPTFCFQVVNALFDLFVTCLSGSCISHAISHAYYFKLMISCNLLLAPLFPVV